MKISRSLEFDAGHRLLNHEGKCKHLHGHRYKAVIEVEADELDSMGRVIDFSVVKEKIGGWIDTWWDHNTILHNDDPLAEYLCTHADRLPYLTPHNPTAENLVKELFYVTVQLLPPELRVTKITLWETPNCCAIYEPLVG